MSKGRLPRYYHIVCKHHWPRNLPDHPCCCLFCHVCRRLMWLSCWTNTLFLPVHQKLGNLYLLPARNTASQSVLFQEAFPSGRGLLSCLYINQHARKVLQIKIPNMQLLVQIYKICLVVLLPIRYSFLYNIIVTCITLSGMIDPLKLTCSQQLWLHSSVGRALHRYRRGHGFESR